MEELTSEEKSINKMTRLLSLLNYFFAATSAFLTISIIIILMSMNAQSREMIQRVDQQLEEHRKILEEIVDKYEE